MSLTEVKDIFNAITGWDWFVEELLKAGERIINLQRLVNVRDGIRRKDDKLPQKMFQAAKEGPRKDKTPIPFEPALQDYYKRRGWSEDGIPTRERLKKLGLEEYISYLP